MDFGRCSSFSPEDAPQMPAENSIKG